MIDLIKYLTSGICSKCTAETEAVGTQLGALLPNNSVLALHGNLGVGKTTLVRGLAKAWGINEAVTSPTFNLYTIYNGDRQLVHFDAYRLSCSADLDALMIEDFLLSPWCLAVEWPARISEALPEGTWHLQLKINADYTHTISLLKRDNKEPIG